MANGDIIKLGTLYMDADKLTRPTRPWGDKPTGTPDYGNLQKHTPGTTLEIRDTDENDDYKIQWVEVNVGNKKLLICDRNILYVFWDDLNNQSLIEGKNITIDGQRYLLRVLAGGSNCRISNDRYSGAIPTNNEWDRIIMNEGNFKLLPYPSSTDIDNMQNETDRLGAHNSKWNWYSCYSWCKEKFDANGRVYRGYVSAKYFGYVAGNYPNMGWRPVLEVLNDSPTISGIDSNLGDKDKSFNIQYTVNDTDSSDILTISEKIDGVIINVINNAERNKEYTLNVDVSSLLEGIHTIEIEVQDGKGDISLSNAAKRIYTFNKISKTKFLIKQEDKYYSIKPEYYNAETKKFNSITLIASEPSEEEIKNFGFDDVGTLTDSMTVGADTFRPVDKLDNSFKVELYKV